MPCLVAEKPEENEPRVLCCFRFQIIKFLALIRPIGWFPMIFQLYSHKIIIILPSLLGKPREGGGKRKVERTSLGVKCSSSYSISLRRSLRMLPSKADLRISEM